MSIQGNYDSDSLLPLGWEGGEDEWPGCDRILPTAHGPHGERFAKDGDKVYSAGFVLEPSEFLGRACDALTKVRHAKPSAAMSLLEAADLGDPVAAASASLAMTLGVEDHAHPQPPCDGPLPIQGK